MALVKVKQFPYNIWNSVRSLTELALLSWFSASWQWYMMWMWLWLKIDSPHPVTATLQQIQNLWLVKVNTITHGSLTSMILTHLYDYVIHPNCPFDHCQPPWQLKNSAWISTFPVDQMHGVHVFNHSGILCGACQELTPQPFPRQFSRSPVVGDYIVSP